MYRIRRLADVPSTSPDEATKLEVLLNQMEQGGWKFVSPIPYPTVSGGSETGYLFRQD